LLGNYPDPAIAALVPPARLGETPMAAFGEYGQNGCFPHTNGPVEGGRRIGDDLRQRCSLLKGGIMGTLYDADILEWSEQQAALLRRHAESERANDGAIDWENVIDEVESVGREQLHAVESLLTVALAHMLKSQAWPVSREVPHWQAEARLFRRQARRRFSPSMRQKIDLAGLYADALAALPETIDDQAPLPVPDACPVTLDELLADAL
jgi:hypothetical protein